MRLEVEDVDDRDLEGAVSSIPSTYLQILKKYLSFTFLQNQEFDIGRFLSISFFQIY